MVVDEKRTVLDNTIYGFEFVVICGIFCFPE